MNKRTLLSHIKRALAVQEDTVRALSDTRGLEALVNLRKQAEGAAAALRAVVLADELNQSSPLEHMDYNSGVAARGCEPVCHPGQQEMFEAETASENAGEEGVDGAA